MAIPFSVRQTDWQRDADALRAVRQAVFIDEQGVPEALEWDAADATSVHVLAVDASGTPIGCARLLADATIGRVAVLRAWRGRGVGAALMARIMAIAYAAGHRRVALHSQVGACAFYARLGFVAEGGVYDEVGIAHQTMACALEAAPSVARVAPRHAYSLAYLTTPNLTPPQMIDVAAELGYRRVGLRPLPNALGAPCQRLLDEPAMMRETLARVRATGVGVYDLEIVRIGERFDPRACLPLLDAGAALDARAVLVAGDDPDIARLAASFARLCDVMATFDMSANLEFMPWTSVPDARTALRVLDAAGRPSNAGILVDALHFGRSATTLEDIAALPHAHLRYAQVCDAEAGRHFTVQEMIHTARSERQLPGDGNIDLVALFGVLPHDIAIGVEVPNHVRCAQLGEREWARRALGASRAVLETAGR